MKTKQTAILVMVLALVIGAIVYLENQKPERATVTDTDVSPIMDNSARIKEKQSRFEVAKEVSTPDGFINMEGISVGELIGKKVILIDFWTYSCINCQRTFPFLKAWYEKYKDQGLEIIAVHTPEFEFEKKYENVVAAVEKFGISYPVVLDNDFSTWQAYNNRYWPRKYLIDIDGYIVYDHIGEGGYEETEKKIQELLSERAQVLGEKQQIADTISSAKEVSLEHVQSPETYFGSLRNQNFANGAPGVEGIQEFSVPAVLNLNKLYLAGTWNITPEFAENIGEASIVFLYSAQNVFFVADSENEITLTVKIDGKETKSVVIDRPGLHVLVEESEPGTHALEIFVPESGLKAFTFTFG